MSAYDTPIIIVECDECGAKVEYELEYRGSGWSDSGLRAFLKREYWKTVDDDIHYCEDCHKSHRGDLADDL